MLKFSRIISLFYILGAFLILIPAQATDEDVEKDHLIDLFLPYVIPPDELDGMSDTEAESYKIGIKGFYKRRYSNSDAKRGSILAPCILKEVNIRGERFTTILNFLKELLSSIPVAFDDQLCANLTSSPSKGQTLTQRKNDILDFLKYPFSEEATFPMGDTGYFLMFRKKFIPKTDLSEDFIKDLPDFTVHFDHATSDHTSSAFLLFDENKKLVGYRTLNVDLKNHEVSGQFMTIARRIQGKGLGKKFFLETLKLIATNVVWGYWGTPFSLVVVSKEAQEMVKSVHEKDKLPMNIVFRKRVKAARSTDPDTMFVDIKMEDIRKHFS